MGCPGRVLDEIGDQAGLSAHEEADPEGPEEIRVVIAFLPDSYVELTCSEVGLCLVFHCRCFLLFRNEACFKGRRDVYHAVAVTVLCVAFASFRIGFMTPLDKANRVFFFKRTF